MDVRKIRLWVSSVAVAACLGMPALPAFAGQESACQAWVLTGRPDGPFTRMFDAAQKMCPNIPVCTVLANDGEQGEVGKLLDSGRVSAVFLPLSQLRNMGDPETFAVVANAGLIHYHILTVRPITSEHRRPSVFPNDALPFGVFANDAYVANALADTSSHVQLSLDDSSNLTVSGLAAIEVMRKHKIRALLVSGERASVKFSGQRQEVPWLDTVDFAAAPPPGFLIRKDAKGRRILAEPTAVVVKLPVEMGARRALSAFRSCLSENFSKLRATDTQWQDVERLDGVPGFSELASPPPMRLPKKK